MQTWDVSSHVKIQLKYRDSPLGLILKNWQKLTGKNPLLSKPELIRLSETIWPTYELNNNEVWPKFGSLDEELISNLVSHKCQDQYFGEFECVRLFMLLSHNEKL